jgi:hypothetical protein
MSNKTILTDFIEEPTENLEDLGLNFELLNANFQKCIRGYHLINSEPINETVWESINCQILVASGHSIDSSSKGSHSCGRDILCDFGGLSNKSSKYSKGKTEFSISSYRLTTVCSDKDCGIIDSIIGEIESRKNYEYYSFIVRNELEKEIEYDWFIIPSNCSILSPENYEWSAMIGQRGKKTGEQVGWKTNEIEGSKMSITFSMSSQLWITVNVTEELKKYIVGSVKVSNQPKFNYLQIADLL